jgi:DNA-binding NtrC family response regulator
MSYLSNIAPGKEAQQVEERRCIILVVDDEELMGNYIEEVLQRTGYEHVAFTEPEKALEFLAWNADRIDLIISDIKMPGMNGIALAREAERTKAGIPVILLSAYTVDSMDVGEAPPPNVRAILEKPLLRTDLLRTIEEAIGDCNLQEPTRY